MLMKHLSADHAAEILGISPSTIRNWAKAGHITPVQKRPLTFREDSVRTLKDKIGTDSFEKLKARANKIGSATKVIPIKYSANNELSKCIENIVAKNNTERLKIAPLMFLAAVRLLELHGEMIKQDTPDVFDLNSYHSWARESVKAEITEWRLSLKNIEKKDRYLNFFDGFTFVDSNDFLGLLYQSLSSEGSKSDQGIYYTPSKIVEGSIDQLDRPIETFLDPCCGTGQYLVAAARILCLNPENIHGFDCDPTAVNIARINLLLAVKNIDFVPNIYCLDSLHELATGNLFCQTNNLIGRFDAIATNPPWGAYKNSTPSKQFEQQVKSSETFSLFLAKSIDLLRDGGQLSFLLPESILKVKIHADIRKLVLKNSQIRRIVKLGRQFTDVFTPVIRLDLVKQLPEKDWLISVDENEGTHFIEQERFKNNQFYSFDVEITSPEEELLNRIYSAPHQTLLGNAEWALGIVTGENKKHVLESKEVETEPVFRGRDVQPFKLGEPKSFIDFKPNKFQQVAPERFFRAPEKLIYKFISTKLVFAYDAKQCLTLNSANILIPTIPGMSLKVVLAFLNSHVFQYIFRKKFATHKVLRGDLEQLPFPLINTITHDKIETLVDLILNGEKVRNELEDLLFSTFNLEGHDVKLINEMVNDSTWNN